MKLLSLAWRNILRNRRRTHLTLAAVAMATAAMLLLGGYVNATVRALETDAVRHAGHLQIVSKGFLAFGRGNPARFAIRDYETIANALRADPQLQAMLVTVTPVLQLQGVVGNYAAGTSTSFAGAGWDPEARRLMMAWDGNDMGLAPGAVHIDKEMPNGGIIGANLAQLLGMCGALSVKDCAALPVIEADLNAPAMSTELAQLAHSATPDASARGPSVELMASGAGGAPNVVRMEVLRAQRQGTRDVDAMFVGVPLGLAERLLFGPNGKGASALVLQLARSGDIDAARARIASVLGVRAAQFDVHDFHVMQPNFDQVVGMFTAIFRFVAVLMAVVTLFTVTNTINMAVSERTGEIGTLRALGFKRRHVRRMFLIEGALIGAIGATAGTVGAILLGEYALNMSDASWTPPGRSAPVPLAVEILGNPQLILTAVMLFCALACASSYWPARRAAQLHIVEALRHV